MPSTRQQLLKAFDEAYLDIRSALDDVDDIEFQRIWLDGRWRVRDITAHLTGWLGQLAGGMERMSRGEKPNPHDSPWTQVDAWNQTFASHARGKHKADVLHELQQAVGAFRNASAKLPDDRFGDGKTANQMFDLAGISHFREHAEMIRSWCARENR